MRKLFFIITIICFFVSSCGENQIITATPPIIPKPVNAKYNTGFYKPENKCISVICNKDSSYLEMQRLAHILQKGFQETAAIKTRIGEKGQIKLILNHKDSLNIDGYKLNIDNSGVKLEAKNTAGIFYGIQTLLQIINKHGLRYCSIKDYPAFRYRGLHLDVSRHFMPVSYIKELLNLMSYYKLNKFHWHLVDGGGWRFESKEYPLLTQKAQARPESDWTKWWINGDRKFVDSNTPNCYEGFYTQQQMRDIVKYAKDRYITVIPEIEMPGHSNEIFFAYPDLKCINADKNTSELCIGNPQTFEFLEKILDETISIFPSKFIHIGGDEAGKDNWKKCPKCQALMRKEGLKNEDELQSYCIKKIEKYLNSKGREIIGWDEILQGGLAPNATVMSWRGEGGGIKAAQMQHNVIMTPGTPLYFDFYQSCPINEPVAIGGYNSLKDVYSYNPVPKELDKKYRKYIIGAQANLWTEFVPNPAHAEYMTWPRAMALAELTWTPKNEKNYNDFLLRANIHTLRLLKKGINAFPLKNMDITTKTDTIKKEIKVYIKAERVNNSIHYTTDGSNPTYKSPVFDSVIVVKDSAHLVLQLFDEYKPLFKPIHFDVDYHKAIGKKVIYNNPYYKGYSAGGDNALTDGYTGSWTYLDKRWQGFLAPMDCTIDMGKEETIHYIKLRFMQVKGAWVYTPESVEVLLSKDNKKFKSIGIIKTKISRDYDKLIFESFHFHTNMSARYIRIKTKTKGIKGEFLFTDEVIVY